MIKKRRKNKRKVNMLFLSLLFPLLFVSGYSEEASIEGKNEYEKLQDMSDIPPQFVIEDSTV